jgi:uncharacterized glyoxalase superfamily protein PhnB
MAGSTVIPCMRYRDAVAAIDWLCDVFGFTKHAVYANEDGTIAHAELRHGNGMIMLGSVLKEETEFGKQIKQPDEIGGYETQSPYIIVADVDAVYAKVKASHAEIVMEIKDQTYGSRDFSCRDLEGHLWSFGTYDPWSVTKQDP